jgi:hypothetical protein
MQQHVGQFIVEDGCVFRGAEIASGNTPVANRLGHPRDQLTHSGFSLRGVDLAVQVLAGDDVGRRHRPI